MEVTTSCKGWGGSLLLILIIASFLVVPVIAADNTSNVIENTTVLVGDNSYVDQTTFWFIAFWACIFFVISVFIKIYPDLFAGIATVFLGATAWLSSRVARYDVYAVLDPRVVNESNMTVLQESRSLIHPVMYVHPEPIAQVIFGVLFVISLIWLIYLIIVLYISPKLAKEESE